MGVDDMGGEELWSFTKSLDLIQNIVSEVKLGA